MPDSPRIVFMGSPDFAVASLDALVAADFAPIAVVTVPDRPAGRGKKMRGSAVKAAAERHGLPLMQPESMKDERFQRELAALEPDILAVVAFRILPAAVYETATLGAFNLHGSLLPAYRGAAPLNRALMDGVTETGVTTFFLRKSVDTGDVILKRAVSVGPDETAGELHDRLAAVGAEAVVETVRRIAAGGVATEPQDDALASPAPKIFREDGELDWTRTATQIHDHVRALAPRPGTWTTWTPDGDAPESSETLKVLNTQRLDDVSDDDAAAAAIAAGGAPGEVLVADGRLIVACGQGAIELTEVQRPGSRRLPAADVLNGADLAPGDRMG